MSRAEPESNVRVIGIFNILVCYQQANGRAGSEAIADTGQNLDSIFLPPGGRRGALTGPPSIHLFLYIRPGEGQTGGAAINDDPHTFTVTFAEAGYSE